MVNIKRKLDGVTVGQTVCHYQPYVLDVLKNATDITVEQIGRRYIYADGRRFDKETGHMIDGDRALFPGTATELAEWLSVAKEVEQNFHS